jgi:phage baseplate assembly protein gpV
MNECECSRHASPGPAFRVGIVSAVDALTAQVRVVFPDYDQMSSYWLPVVVPKSQNDKAYWIPDLGEQVVCIMDLRDEAGAVLGAIYSNTDVPPVASTNKWHLGFSDGSAFEYDRALHILDLRFADTTDFRYDAAQHIMSCAYQDGSLFKYDANAHQMLIAFDDGASIKYDAGAHLMTLAFQDGATFKYDAAGHALTIVSAGSVEVTSSNGATIQDDSTGITLISGGSQVSISPQGVAIVPPLPTTSTVAQT